MAISNYSSSIGQKIGKTFEAALSEHITRSVARYGATARSESLLNGDDNEYDIDFVIRDKSGDARMLLEFKFIRYKKHNRDKGSWIKNAHGALRRSHPTITHSVAVLGGNWSKPSLEMLMGNTHVLHIPFEVFANAYRDAGVVIEWPETHDGTLPKTAWEAEGTLSESAKSDIGNRIIDHVKDGLDSLVDDCLAG